MQISRKSEYAIHSLMILAFNLGEEMSVDELAMMQEISRTYLAKVMQKLAGAGLVQSNKGFKGGYSLTIPPDQITFAQIVAIFETAEDFYDCLHQERKCQMEKNCLIHKSFQKAYKMMMSELNKVYISDLLGGYEHG